MFMRIMKTPTEMGKSIAIEWEGELLLLGWVVAVVLGLVVDAVMGWVVDVVGSSTFRLNDLVTLYPLERWPET